MAFKPAVGKIFTPWLIWKWTSCTKRPEVLTESWSVDVSMATLASVFETGTGQVIATFQNIYYSKQVKGQQF